MILRIIRSILLSPGRGPARAGCPTPGFSSPTSAANKWGTTQAGTSRLTWRQSLA